MAPKQQSKLKKVVRKRILDEGTRIDGRDTKTVRPIEIQPGILPRAHHRYAGQRPVLGLLRRPGLPRQQEVYSFCCTDRR